MKSFTSLLFHYLGRRASRRNLAALARMLLVLAGLIAVYSTIFHYLMLWEDPPQEYSWVTGVYWTLTVMSTLGFGDITFHTDLGRVFSILVLMSGTIFILILLPFTFIQFFYAPWMEAQAAARAPRSLPESIEGHVVLTQYGPVDEALVKKLDQFQYPYAILASDLDEALRLYDLDLRVVVGDLDDPETYRKIHLEKAALVASTQSDVVNTSVAFTAREVCEEIPIVTTARASASTDVLNLAGATRVLRLADMMGQSLARRVIGRDAKAHVIGRFDGLLIAEAIAADTPLVDRTLREIRLRDHANVSVVGVWERGQFHSPGPETRVTRSSVLVLAGDQDQLTDYDALFCIYRGSAEPVVILGGGRVGRATAHALAAQGFDYRIVERLGDRIKIKDKTILGDAAELSVLNRAGIQDTPAVVITTHDDDLNVYLTLYCRKLRDDVQIISRATLERTVGKLHRAGADFVISEASMGANAIFNLLRRTDILLLSEGLDVFKAPVPPSLAGKTLAATDLRRETGCSVIAIDAGDGARVNPDPESALPDKAELILIGDAESEERFLGRYVNR